jgi:hypothetical protein
MKCGKRGHRLTAASRSTRRPPSTGKGRNKNTREDQLSLPSITASEGE